MFPGINQHRSSYQESEIYTGGSAQLVLYLLYSEGHNKLLKDESTEYFSKFMKKINEIFSTQRDILDVIFTLAEADLWDPSTKPLEAELLKKELKKYSTTLDTEWGKRHPGVPLSAVLYLTTEPIMNETGRSQPGINGRIGGICLVGEKIAAVTDDGNFTGVRDAAIQLSVLMGAVYDGESPPGSEFVIGSDGAQECDPKDGFLMGEWKDYQKSFNLSECTPYQAVMGLRQRGTICYGTPEEKKKLLETTM
ncbi:uncharacterized protein LOC115320236 [Ixodes scapularis]|uniref:uncharacterized protein LOC115320236 n=1 Tax=Ixodes scapularis TaxID=6945 RepID=UPI001A9DF085|nr:uncharacterized protein LOC115320236 [Ixodes scapularis]